MKKRPGALWMFFYGRPRRGVPWLLLGVGLATLGLALLFAIPGGVDISRFALGFLIGLLVVAIFAAVVVAVLFPRRRGR